MPDISAELPSAPPPVETINFDSEIAPIPEGWTMLIHGTDKGRGFMDQEVVTIEDQGTDGLSAITREAALSELSRGIDTNGGYAGDEDPAEIRIVFPKPVNGYGRFPDEALGLNSAESRLRRSTYRGNSERIPNGTELIRVGKGQGNNGRDAYFYIPATLAETYIQTVTQETGQPPTAVVEALERYRLQQEEHNLGAVALSTETNLPEEPVTQAEPISSEVTDTEVGLPESSKPPARLNAERDVILTLSSIANMAGLPTESLRGYISQITDQGLIELLAKMNSPIMKENPNANSLLGNAAREARSNLASGYKEWLQRQAGAVY